jgi:ribosomal protein L12E/L44/L45/RPP1/RPP2
MRDVVAVLDEQGEDIKELKQDVADVATVAIDASDTARKAAARKPLAEQKGSEGTDDESEPSTDIVDPYPAP